MILFEHDLGRHVARSPAIFVIIDWHPFLSNAEICQAEVTILVKDEIFWFDVPVYDALVMNSL